MSERSIPTPALAATPADPSRGGAPAPRRPGAPAPRRPGAPALRRFVALGARCTRTVTVFPDRTTAGTLSHAGNWRAAGIDQVSIDVDIRTGPLGGFLSLLLVSDPGTPTLPADDCIMDLTRTPTPTGLVPVQPGETWRFTCWYRDAVGGLATSNLADGYTVVFQ